MRHATVFCCTLGMLARQYQESVCIDKPSTRSRLWILYSLRIFDPVDGDNEEQWERKHGSGPAGTSQADVLQETSQGRRKLQELREMLKRAQERKAQVGSATA